MEIFSDVEPGCTERLIEIGHGVENNKVLNLTKSSDKRFRVVLVDNSD